MPIALTWPALGMPTVIPYCCCTSGSDAVASIRPNSIGGPAYWSTLGSTDETATVVVGNLSGAPARTCPGGAGMAAPFFVTSWLDTPL